MRSRLNPSRRIPGGGGRDSLRFLFRGEGGEHVPEKRGDEFGVIAEEAKHDVLRDFRLAQVGAIIHGGGCEVVLLQKVLHSDGAAVVGAAGSGGIHGCILV